MAKKIILLVIFTFILISCNKNEKPDTEIFRKEIKDEIHTYRVASQTVQSYIEATGTIQPDIEGMVKIISHLPGRVEGISVKIGDSIKKGEPLITIMAPDISDTYSNYISSLSQLKQAERSYNLNKQLFEVGAVTKNDLMISEAGYEQLKAISEGLKKKLEIYDASSKDGFKDRFVIDAPIDGHIADIQSRIGERIDAGSLLMTIANPDRLMVVANIYDTDFPKIQKGREVVFYTDVFPDERFKGVVSYISDVEDIDSKTVKTYIKVINGINLFKQNMFLKIKISDREDSLPAVSKDSLIYKNGHFYVYIKNNGRFEIKEVKPLRDISEKLMAIEGLKDGDEIASSAIDMEKT